MISRFDGPVADAPSGERRDGDLDIVEYSLDGPLDLSRLAADKPSSYPFLLESSAGAAAQSRFDFLLAFPEYEVASPAAGDGENFFERLDHLLTAERRPPVAGLPFVGGWFVYLGYEMAAVVEPSLELPRPLDDIWPDAFAVRCPAAIILDRARRRLMLVAERGDPARLATLQADIAASRSALPSTPVVADWWEQTPARFTDAVERARALIAAGDVFQVNLSRAWQGELAEMASPARLYAALRGANPAPFSALMQWRGAALVCSSPERMLLVDDDWAQTRPIAGTRVRTAGTDRDMTRDLITHPKERAEHIMLIDLERNDLGRVCRAGTIDVDELMVTESYAHVHHIVSNIRGRPRPDVLPGRIMQAVFPGGTITGCPKVRCMEVIAALETEGRGAYTGSVGYLSRCGRMDTNIVIRSFTQQGRRLTLRTGAGIVADSVPERELDETRFKARGVLRGFVDTRGTAHG